MAENYVLQVGTQIKDDTQAQLNKMGVKKVQVTYVTKGDEKLQRVQTQYVNSTGQIITATKELNSAGVQTSNTMSKVSQSYKDVAEKVQTAEKHVKSLGERFLDNTKKVAQFAVSTAILGTFTSTVYQAVEAVTTMDASLTELTKVSDLTGDSLTAYTQDAFDMASQLSTTASNVTDATAQFVQAGYDLGESKGLSKYAIMLQTISDKTMDIDDSTNFLTSTIKAFNMTASDAEGIINSVNEVSNKYAITSNDLTDNLGKVAGVAGIAGVNFSELTGLMVSSVEKTRNASKSANAFKSIFINLQQMDKDGVMPKLSKQFGEFGLSMTDTNGATKDAYQLLKELSEVYKEVSASTDVDKQNKMRSLLEDIGG